MVKLLTLAIMTDVPIRDVISTTVKQIASAKIVIELLAKSRPELFSVFYVNTLLSFNFVLQIALFGSRPNGRAPLGHTLLYNCQGALMLCLTKHAIKPRFIFFVISRHYHLKWLSSYVNHISGYVLTLKETMSCPLFPDSYAFS